MGSNLGAEQEHFFHSSLSQIRIDLKYFPPSSSLITITAESNSITDLLVHVVLFLRIEKFREIGPCFVGLTFLQHLNKFEAV